MPNYFYTSQEVRDMAAKLDKISRQALSYYNAYDTRGYPQPLGRGLCVNDNWNVSQGYGTLLENKFLRAIGQGDKVTAKYAKERLAHAKQPREPQPQPQPEPKQSNLYPCPKCNGTGEHTCTDWVPYGSTNVPMDSSEYCSCIGDDRVPASCPMCGLPITWDESIEIFNPCPCGWHDPFSKA